jgi:hypothetical protein
MPDLFSDPLSAELRRRLGDAWSRGKEITRAANTQIKIRHSIPSHDQLPQSGPAAAEWSLARIEAAVVIVWAYVQELAAGGVSEPARACLLDEMESVQDFMALSPEERMAVYSKIEVLRARAIGSGA